jgi:hypothetical protein
VHGFRVPHPPNYCTCVMSTPHRYNSPCHYPEITNAYAAALAQKTADANAQGVSPRTHTMKIRANVFNVSDTAKFPPKFCEEMDGHLYDYNRNGKDDCYCGFKNTDYNYYDTDCACWGADCADCSCGGVRVTDVSPTIRLLAMQRIRMRACADRIMWKCGICLTNVLRFFQFVVADTVLLQYDVRCR